MKHAVWDWKAHFTHQDSSTVFDCMIAQFLLSQGKFVVSEAETLVSNGVNTVEELAKKQDSAFAKLGSLYTYFTSIEMPMIPVLWQMEQSGIFLDVTALQHTGEEIDTARTHLEESMKKEVGVDINLNSSTQIGSFLAEKLRVPLKKTKTGKYATNETEITQYAQQFPFIQKLLEYRELSKLRSTYVDSLIAKVDDHSRIHTSYTQVAANTGRLSSSNPNMQNIPGSLGFGQKIKSSFKAGDGNVLVSFDYSQQELRILAHLSQEKTLIQAFQEKIDIHTATAAKIFHVEFNDVTPQQRRIAKSINFGIVYGMSNFGMSSQLHIPVDEAQQFINTFNATYPNIHKYYEGYLNQGRMNGFVQTILGRRRYVFEHDGQKTIDNSMRRVLINYPIQGSAADLMKKAMVTIHEEIIKVNPHCKLLLQIHDDLVFEIKDDKKNIEDVVQKVRDIMCSVYPLSVPIEVDVKIGKNWGEMEKIDY